MSLTRAMSLVVSVLIVLSSCRSLPGPEEMTADGLERVASRKSAGVYRLPGATFTQYRRLILEPLTVSFVKNWEESHPDISAGEIKRIREEAARMFREEFTRELIKRGKYEYANDAGADVLIVTPAVTDLDIPAPDSNDLDKRSFAPRSPSMTITGEMRDASTGKLVGRVIKFAGGERYGFHELREANRGTNAFETRVDYAVWVQVFREALNVAKAERPRHPPTSAPQP